MSELFWLYRMWKDGHLPDGNARGVWGQPNKAAEAFRIMDNAKSDAMNEKQLRAQRRNAAMAAAGIT